MNILIEDIDHFLDFKIMTRAYKAKLFKGITTVYFSRNQVLYEEGQSSDCIYFVLEGEYEVSKNFNVSKHNEELHVDYLKMNPSQYFSNLCDQVSIISLEFSNF